MLPQLTATKKMLRLWLSVSLLALPQFDSHAQMVPIGNWNPIDVEFRSAGTALSACPGSTPYGMVLSKPSGVVANDLLFAQVWISNNANNKTVTPPAGWVEIRNDVQFNGTYYVRQYLFYKVATGSEGTNYTFTASAANCGMGVIVAYKNVKTIAPVDVHSCDKGNSEGFATAPSITTTKHRARIVYTFVDAWAASSAPDAWPFTRDIFYDASNGYGSFVQERKLGAAGATGATTNWSANGNPWIGCHVALKPSSSVTFRDSTGYVYASGSTTVTINKPSGVVAGDLLIAVVTTNYAAGTNVTYTPPSGWTQLRNDANFDGFNTTRIVILYKVAGGSEPANYTFTGSSNPIFTETRGGIIAYSGVDSTTPFDANNCTTGTSSPSSTPSITTTVANAQLLWLFTQNNNHDTGPDHGNPLPLTQRWLLASGSDIQTIYGADRGTTTAGATGDKTFSTSPGNQWLACQVALVPAR